MKKALFLAVLLSGALSAQDTARVLFVGNSYTYVNDLPQLVDDIANSFGNDLVHDSHTPGGNTMKQHSLNNTLMNKLDDDDWNFVVLQSQSQEPSFSPSQVAADVYPYAANLCDSIIANNNCAEPLFFMTWGRENGDDSNCQYYPPICTYDGMQTRLAESYTEMSLNNATSLSPVGEVWRDVRTLYPSYNLYSSDGSHPSLLGSYLAACTFYEIIWQSSCIGASYPSGISATEAANIQNAVNQVATEDLSSWLAYGNIPFVDPTYSLSNGELLTFNSHGENANNYLWEFGDGNNLPGDSGEYTFTGASGLYTVNLVYSNDCHSYETHFFIETAIGLEETFHNFNIYIEHKMLSIVSEQNLVGAVSIYNLEGKLLSKQSLNGNNLSINLQHLPKGSYIIQLNDAKGFQFGLK